MTTRAPLILAIESSCDETAVALYSKADGILANEVYPQTDLPRQDHPDALERRLELRARTQMGTVRVRRA